MAGHPEGTIGWDTPIPEPMIYQSGVATGRSQPRPMPLPPCPPARLTAQGAELSARLRV